MINDGRTWLLLDLNLLIIRYGVLLLLHASYHVQFLLEVFPLLIYALIDYLLVLLDFLDGILLVLQHLDSLGIGMGLVSESILTKEALGLA